MPSSSHVVAHIPFVMVEWKAKEDACKFRE